MNLYGISMARPSLQLLAFARFVAVASKHTSPSCTAATCAKCLAMAILAPPAPAAIVDHDPGDEDRPS